MLARSVRWAPGQRATRRSSCNRTQDRPRCRGRTSCPPCRWERGWRRRCRMGCALRSLVYFMLVSDPTRRIFLAELQQSPDEAADPEQPPRYPYCPCYLLYLLEHVAAVLLSCFHPWSVLSCLLESRGGGTGSMTLQL